MSSQEEIMRRVAEIGERIEPQLNLFREHGRAASPTFQFWDDFLFKVLRPVKIYIRATRHGEWDAYESATAHLLSLLFATNRSNYVRYMPVVLLQLQRLPSDILEGFKGGHFVSKISKGKFNSVWIDYTIEATENKALKGAGGIIGLTLRGPALVRWFLSRPITAQYSEQIRQNIAKTRDIDPSCHLGEQATKRWDRDVERMTQMFKEQYIDLFDVSDSPCQLVNFATGAAATPAVQTSMLSAIETGNYLMGKFIEERLVVPKEGEKKSFYDTLPRTPLKTLTDMKKTVKVHHKDITMDAEVMYLRLLAVNCKKKVPLKRELSYENAPVPPSIFTEDGLLVSGVKSDFMHKLEELVPGEKISKIDASDAIIFDGHAVIQMLTPPFSSASKITFQIMARRFMNILMETAKNVCSKEKIQIHVVFDRYLESSVKGQTRQKRGDSRGGIVYHIQPETSIPPNWKQFLATGQNKANLAEYYLNAFMVEKAGPLLAENILYVSGGQGEKAVQITNHDNVEYQDLKSNHEEADTRICVHARVAAENGADHIVVNSPDTDVLVLLLHHRAAIRARSIFFLTGREGKHSNLSRYIPVHQIHDKLEKRQRNILMSVYCLTGCDTVSSFWGHGKKAAYRLIMQKSEKFQDLSHLGQHMILQKAEKIAARKFVGALYGKTECESLNELRCENVSVKHVPAKKLPPTEDSFDLHLQRCIYQLRVWQEAVVPMQHVLDPIDFGYEKTPDGKSFVPKMMNQPPAAPELLNDIMCNCPPKSCAMQCKCLENEQPCTSACNCEGLWLTDGSEETSCANPLTQTVLCDSDSDRESDDSEEI